MRPCGKKSVGCSSTRNGLSRSIADACSNNSKPLMNSPASRRGWDGCYKGLHA
jgi:hypothetical protein